jgi:hypothetical protein
VPGWPEDKGRRKESGQPGRSYEDLQRLLLDELREARNDYASAKAFFKDVTSLSQELGPGHADGAFQVRKAIFRQRQALLRYSKAVKAYTDFTLYGKIPEDEPEKPEA